MCLQMEHRRCMKARGNGRDKALRAVTAIAIPPSLRTTRTHYTFLDFLGQLIWPVFVRMFPVNITKYYRKT